MANKYFSLMLILFVANATAWYRTERHHNPDNPGKCTYDGQIILSPGEIIDYPDEKCAIITCMLNGFVSVQGCGVYSPPSNCKLGEPIHKDAPYPECCQQHVICNDIDATLPPLDEV